MDRAFATESKGMEPAQPGKRPALPEDLIRLPAVDYLTVGCAGGMSCSRRSVPECPEFTPDSAHLGALLLRPALGRVSSAIVDNVGDGRAIRTSSGGFHTLDGPPAYDGNGQWVWEAWVRRHGIGRSVGITQRPTLPWPKGAVEGGSEGEQ